MAVGVEGTSGATVEKVGVGAAESTGATGALLWTGAGAGAAELEAGGAGAGAEPEPPPEAPPKVKSTQLM